MAVWQCVSRSEDSSTGLPFASRVECRAWELLVVGAHLGMRASPCGFGRFLPRQYTYSIDSRHVLDR